MQNRDANFCNMTAVATMDPAQRESHRGWLNLVRQWFQCRFLLSKRTRVAAECGSPKSCAAVVSGNFMTGRGNNKGASMTRTTTKLDVSTESFDGANNCPEFLLGPGDAAKLHPAMPQLESAKNLHIFTTYIEKARGARNSPNPGIECFPWQTP
jgi:hypothetical protein